MVTWFSGNTTGEDSDNEHRSRGISENEERK
jgi:hypothetical protein